MEANEYEGSTRPPLCSSKIVQQTWDQAICRCLQISVEPDDRLKESRPLGKSSFAFYDNTSPGRFERSNDEAPRITKNQPQQSTVLEQHSVSLLLAHDVSSNPGAGFNQRHLTLPKLQHVVSTHPYYRARQTLEKISEGEEDSLFGDATHAYYRDHQAHEMISDVDEDSLFGESLINATTPPRPTYNGDGQHIVAGQRRIDFDWATTSFEELESAYSLDVSTTRHPTRSLFDDDDDDDEDDDDYDDEYEYDSVSYTTDDEESELTGLDSEFSSSISSSVAKQLAAYDVNQVLR